VIPGAFFTYSNAAKVRCGVPAEIIASFGVYSAETAAAMARTCREFYRTDLGVGVTGTFGNVDPNNPDSVPGEVYFAIDARGGTTAWHCDLPVQPSRLAYKLYMADVIADRLLALIYQ
jgi:nicotinamide mononucleotide (NMN) deamidase PncC